MCLDPTNPLQDGTQAATNTNTNQQLYVSGWEDVDGNVGKVCSGQSPTGPTVVFAGQLAKVVLTAMH